MVFRSAAIVALSALASVSCVAATAGSGRSLPRVRVESVPRAGHEHWRQHWRECAATECGGPLAADAPLKILVALRNKVCDLAWLDEELHAVSDPRSARYGQHYTFDALAAACDHGSDAAFDAVQQWVSSLSTSVVRLRGTDWAEVAGSAADLSELLGGARFRKFTLLDGSKAAADAADRVIVRAPEGYTLPLGLDAHVATVTGVFRFPRLTAHHRPATPLVRGDTPPDIVDITPLKIHQRYGVSGVPNPPPANNVQAVVSFLKQYYSPDDLSKFLAKFGLGNDVDGIANQIGPNDASNPGGEATLDVDYLTGVASGVETWVWSTAGTTPSNNEPFVIWLANVQRDLSQGNMPVLVFSISYQDYEDTVSQPYATAVSADFARFGMMGITIATGSGDWSTGASCSSGPQPECLAFRPDFPSSSPYIVSTGATVLYANGTEAAIGFSSGGFSNIFPQMRSQQSAVSAYLAKHGDEFPSNLFNRSGRAFPDIATVGVQFQVLISGKVVSESGTSASTPTGAALVSLLNSARLSAGLPPMGYVVPFFYAFPDSFTDIVDGKGSLEDCCTKSFEAVPGWDPITGLGVPQFPTMLDHAMSIGKKAN
jgi:tripeptidyl-peptidase-1